MTALPGSRSSADRPRDPGMSLAGPFARARKSTAPRPQEKLAQQPSRGVIVALLPYKSRLRMLLPASTMFRSLVLQQPTPPEVQQPYHREEMFAKNSVHPRRTFLPCGMAAALLAAL